MGRCQWSIVRVALSWSTAHHRVDQLSEGSFRCDNSMWQEFHEIQTTTESVTTVSPTLVVHQQMHQLMEVEQMEECSVYLRRLLEAYRKTQAYCPRQKSKQQMSYLWHHLTMKSVTPQILWSFHFPFPVSSLLLPSVLQLTKHTNWHCCQRRSNISTKYS